VLPRLQALLQQRPAWHVEMLLSQLPGFSEEALKPLLVALCYQFKTGGCSVPAGHACRMNCL
jgi:hypothetical protein